ncbi:MAG TPA: hypothetical protein VHE11_02810 [Steroidobacteraceae bacterium]|nr:hypothetical protein [Steroidobacteraceae bacterium]
MTTPMNLCRGCGDLILAGTAFCGQCAAEHIPELWAEDLFAEAMAVDGDLESALEALMASDVPDWGAEPSWAEPDDELYYGLSASSGLSGEGNLAD